MVKSLKQWLLLGLGYILIMYGFLLIATTRPNQFRSGPDGMAVDYEFTWYYWSSVVIGLACQLGGLAMIKRKIRQQ